jgi:hypothetical protein
MMNNNGVKDWQFIPGNLYKIIDNFGLYLYNYPICSPGGAGKPSTGRVHYRILHPNRGGILFCIKEGTPAFGNYAPELQYYSFLYNGKIYYTDPLCLLNKMLVPHD